MICPKCNGRGKTTEYDGLRKFWCDYKCEACNGTGEVMTEQEWLQTCDTEQLAEFLNLIIRVGPYENEPKDFWEHVYGRGGEHGAKSIVEWLKQPHTKE